MKYLERKGWFLKIFKNEGKRRFRSEVIGSWNFPKIFHMIQLVGPSDKKTKYEEVSESDRNCL
jgi:hypothetical protein